MYEALAFCAILAYIGFRNWLNHDKRRMIHQERMAAMQNGVPLPAVEQEVERRTWNVQRFLLLAGWSWIAVGLGGFMALHIMQLLAQPNSGNQIPPNGSQFAALIPMGIGIAHLITYWSGRSRA